MGRISHLIQKDDRPPSYQIEGVIASIADAMAQGAADRVSPQIASLLSKVEESGSTANTARDRLAGEIKKAISSEISALKPEIRKVAEALSTSNRDMVDLQGRLVDALSNVVIPDYTDQLRRLEAAQPDLSPIIKAINSIEIPEYEAEERADEWVFDIQRNQNGLIKSVTAKAK